jgi:hypothetical protein
MKYPGTLLCILSSFAFSHKGLYAFARYYNSSRAVGLDLFIYPRFLVGRTHPCHSPLVHVVYFNDRNWADPARSVYQWRSFPILTPSLPFLQPIQQRSFVLWTDSSIARACKYVCVHGMALIGTQCKRMSISKPVMRSKNQPSCQAWKRNKTNHQPLQ